MWLGVLVQAWSAGAQTPVEKGFRDFSFGSGATGSPTGEKPESKLWWNDGRWWGSLFSSSAGQHRIHRFNAATQSWVDTGTPLDTRNSTNDDVLWDPGTGHLYVVSHVFTTNAASTSSSSTWGRLFRYTYDTATKRYTLDTGFPVSVTRGRCETLTIAKDSVQRLWVTYVEGGKVKINWSGANDLDWGTPVDLPVPASSASAISVTGDDISSVVSFAGNIGVMWSNQNTGKTYFAVHADTNDPEAWRPTVETVLPGQVCSIACSDDHLNLKADGTGRVFAALKTSTNVSTLPLVVLGVRETTGQWNTYTYGLGGNHHTRPIVLLDEQQGTIYMFSTAPESGGAIYMKRSPINQIAFASGLGEPVIRSATDTKINDATSTKQNVDGSMGLLILANDKANRVYLHNLVASDGTVDPGGASDPPSAPTGLTATAVSGTQVNLEWTDTSSNEDAFLLERGGAQVASLAANSSTYGDTAVSPGTSYTYRVRASNSDGVSSYSNTATVTTPSAGGPTEPTAIGNLTFETGRLLDATSGADRVGGTVQLETTAPLKGSYSAYVPNAVSSYVEKKFTPASDLYVSLYVRLKARPATESRVVQIFAGSAFDTVGNLTVTSTGTVRLRVGSTVVGTSVALQPGQLYRVGIRQKAGSGSNGVLEAYLAVGDQAFGQPFAVLSNGTWTSSPDTLRVGATTNTVDAVFDDIRLATGSMPGPS